MWLQVSRRALLSLMAVFSDILPGYRIRKLSDAELDVKVTKAVQKTRNYEAALLKAYQSYVRLLRGVVSSPSAATNHRRCVQPPRRSSSVWPCC
jgi:nucleolar complex protein 3